MTQKKRQKNAVRPSLVALWLLANSAPVLAQGPDAQTYDMPAQALGKRKNVETPIRTATVMERQRREAVSKLWDGLSSPS